MATNTKTEIYHVVYNWTGQRLVSISRSAPLVLPSARPIQWVSRQDTPALIVPLPALRVGPREDKWQVEEQWDDERWGDDFWEVAVGGRAVSGRVAVGRTASIQAVGGQAEGDRSTGGRAAAE